MAARVGDRVRVKPGKEHDTMTKGKIGIVKEIMKEPALVIQFPGMSKPHKYYVDVIDVEKV